MCQSGVNFSFSHSVKWPNGSGYSNFLLYFNEHEKLSQRIGEEKWLGITSETKSLGDSPSTFQNNWVTLGKLLFLENLTFLIYEMETITVSSFMHIKEGIERGFHIKPTVRTH